MGNHLDGFGVAFKEGMNAVATALVSSDTHQESAEDRAMLYFNEGAVLSHYMEDMEARFKILEFFSDKNHAEQFLRLDDKYKDSYVERYIL